MSLSELFKTLPTVAGPKQENVLVPTYCRPVPLGLGQLQTDPGGQTKPLGASAAAAGAAAEEAARTTAGALAAPAAWEKSSAS